MSFISSGFSRLFRITGRSLDAIGRQLELNPYVERLNPCLRVTKLKNDSPKIAGAFVASSATIVGRVTIGSNSSIWYGSILRADVSTITIGNNVTVGDCTMIHVSSYPKELPTKIGNNVTIGQGAILHGCTIEDGAYVGEGAQIMDGSKLEKNAFLAAGSILSPGKTIPAGQVWSGMPAKFTRNLTPSEISSLERLVEENKSTAIEHAEENAKSWQEIEFDEFEYEEKKYRPDDYFVRLSPEQISFRAGEVEGKPVPGRIFDSQISAKDGHGPSA